MVKSTPVAALALLCCAAPVSADRLLLEDGETHVTLQETHLCGEPVYLAVDAEDPELFSADSPRLQRLLDAATATLAFECDRLAEIRVQGRLKGLRDPVYRGTASAASDWRVSASHSISGQTASDATSSPSPDSRYPEEAPATGNPDGFELLGLRLDLPVPQVRETLSERLGEAPQYDIASGVMTLATGGCPINYNWQDPSSIPVAGWKCLTARFTDQRDARLHHLELVQVVSGQETRPLIRQLIQKFGSPTDQWSATTAPAGQGYSSENLGWGEIIDHNPQDRRPVYQLQAVIYQREDALITIITLQDPSLRPGWTPPTKTAGDGLQL